MNLLQNLDTEEQKSSSSLNYLSITEQISFTEEEEAPNGRKKAKVDTNTRSSLTAKESISANSINSPLNKNIQDTAALMDDSRLDTESEPEEGEITDSEYEEYSSEDKLTSEQSVNSEDSENEGESLWFLYRVPVYLKNPVNKL